MGAGRDARALLPQANPVAKKAGNQRVKSNAKPVCAVAMSGHDETAAAKTKSERPINLQHAGPGWLWDFRPKICRRVSA
jgi:hypothetical protein